MTDQPQQLADAVMRRLDAIARCTEEPGRITRRYATPALSEAMDTVAGWMRGAAMEVRRDAGGNLRGRYPAAWPDAPTLLLGSHLDSVRDAGKFDGPLGVLVALAAVERLAATGRRLPFAIELLAFADEEGLRFHTAYLGSAVVAGAFDPAWLMLTDADGIRLADALSEAGGNPEGIAADRWSGGPLLGYCEVHIEQGPVLEAEELPVGVVTGIAGQSRIAVTLAGTAGHAGTVPMALRHDALCAAAEVVTAAESLGRETPGLVATVGQLTVAPGASNVIPGAVTLSLDVRHADDAVRAAAVARLHASTLESASRRGVTLDWQVAQSNGATPCDPRLTALLERAIAAQGYAPRRLTSGAGHDGVMLAGIAPIAMLFVRCAGGISHNPAESAAAADIAVAIAVLGAFLEQLAQEQTDEHL